jgi:AraC-like DNA-binding protein
VVFNQLRHHCIRAEAEPGFLECSAAIDSATARRLAALGLWPSFADHRFAIGRSRALAQAYADLYLAIGDARTRHAEVMVRFIRIVQLTEQLVRATHDGSSFADRATRLLDEHPEPGFGMADAAQQLGLSVRSFSRRFQRDVRMSPGRYQMHRRMDLALERLAHQPVTEVARSLGYRDPAQFSRQFRAMFGIAPSRLGV